MGLDIRRTPPGLFRPIEVAGRTRPPWVGVARAPSRLFGAGEAQTPPVPAGVWLRETALPARVGVSRRTVWLEEGRSRPMCWFATGVLKDTSPTCKLGGQTATISRRTASLGSTLPSNAGTHSPQESRTASAHLDRWTLHHERQDQKQNRERSQRQKSGRVRELSAGVACAPGLWAVPREIGRKQLHMHITQRLRQNAAAADDSRHFLTPEPPGDAPPFSLFWLMAERGRIWL